MPGVEQSLEPMGKFVVHSFEHLHRDSADRLMVSGIDCELMAKPQIVIPCPGNSCHSQIAEGSSRNLVQNRFEGQSARLHPATQVHPLAGKVMHEVGIDISDHTCTHIHELFDQAIDTIMTGFDPANQSCPTLPASTKCHYFGFPDPTAATGIESEKLAIFRQVRDDINRILLAYIAGRRDAL